MGKLTLPHLPAPWNKRVSLLAKVVVAGGLLWLLIHSFDSEQVASLLLSTGPEIVATVVFLLIMQTAIMTFRWIAILRALHAPLSWPDALRIMFVSIWFNQTLPSSVGGDAMRVWMLHKRGVPWRTGGKAVLVDRLTALLAVVVLIAAGYWFLTQMTQYLPALLTVALLAAAGIGGTLFLIVVDKLPTWLLNNWVMARIASLSRAMRFFLFEYHGRVIVGLTAIVIHLMTALMVWLFATDLGANLSLFDAMVLVPPVILMTAIPITVGGWGVRESAMVAALGIAGVAPSIALAASILLGLSGAIVGIGGGLLWLTGTDRKDFGHEPIALPDDLEATPDPRPMDGRT